MLRLPQEGGGLLDLPAIPQRIISLVPSITENLILFGKMPIGRTSFCIEPRDQVSRIPVVGGTKTPKIQRIVEQKPDLVIANKEENRKEDVEKLEQAGIPVWVTYPVKVLEVPPFMRILAEICEAKPVVHEQIDRCERLAANLSEKQVVDRPKVITLIWKDPWMAVGGDNYMDDMIWVAGGENPFRGKPGRYPQVTAEEIRDARPEIILLPSEPYTFTKIDRDSWRQRVSSWPSPPKVELFSGEDLCWFGPRMERGLENLRTLL